jgi:hypothetical protein
MHVCEWVFKLSEAVSGLEFYFPLLTGKWAAVDIICLFVQLPSKAAMVKKYSEQGGDSLSHHEVKRLRKAMIVEKIKGNNAAAKVGGG